MRYGIIYLLALGLLSGCANSPYSAPVSSVPATFPASNGPHRTQGHIPSAPVVQPQPGVSPSPRAVVIAPGEKRNSSADNAVGNLLQEGWNLYDQQRYDASISVAERGLRIDRHQAELYQLLSRNYLATLQLQQAEQLARQGLTIGSATATQRAQLQQLLQEIAAQY